MSDKEKDKSAELVPVERPPEFEEERVTDLGALGLAAYSPPEGYEDFADREHNGRRIILYMGQGAVVDVVDKGYSIDDVAVPDMLLLRVQGPLEEAMTVFEYPQRYAAPDDAKRVFGRAA